MIACQFFLQVSLFMRWCLLMPACQAACLISVKWSVCGSCLLIWKLMMTARAVPHLKLMTPQRGAGGKGRALGKGEPGRLLHSRILPLPGSLSGLSWVDVPHITMWIQWRLDEEHLNWTWSNVTIYWKALGYLIVALFLGKRDPKTGIILHHIASCCNPLNIQFSGRVSAAAMRWGLTKR